MVTHHAQSICLYPASLIANSKLSGTGSVDCHVPRAQRSCLAHVVHVPRSNRPRPRPNVGISYPLFSLIVGALISVQSPRWWYWGELSWITATAGSLACWSGPVRSPSCHVPCIVTRNLRRVIRVTVPHGTLCTHITTHEVRYVVCTIFWLREVCLWPHVDSFWHLHHQIF